MRILLFVLPLFLIQSVHAYEGIFKILDEQYVETASDLPGSKDLKPDTTIQCAGHICAWVDIVGFAQAVEENGTLYIRGDPLKAAITRYDAWDTITCEKCFVNQWDKEISVYRDGDKIIARLRVWMEWCDKIECRRELVYFYDAEPAPEIYPALSEPQIIITQYNNSMYENVGIKILGNNYTRVSFRYLDKQAVRTSKILHVENTSKGIVFGNITELKEWNIEGTNISRFYNEILLDGNLSKMDINEFDIRVYDPFTDRKADPSNFTIEQVEFAPQRFMNDLLIAVIGVVSTFMIGTLYLFNRTVYRWNIRLF